MLERYFKDKEFVLILAENNGDPWKVLSRGVTADYHLLSQ